VVAVVVFLGAFAVWSLVTGWTPARDEYPVQGVVVAEANGAPQ
jgi:lysozyme